MDQDYSDSESEIVYDKVSNSSGRDEPLESQFENQHAFEKTLVKKTNKLKSKEKSNIFESNAKFKNLEKKLKTHDDLINKCLEIINLIKSLSADSKSIKLVEDIEKYILSCKHELNDLFNKLGKNEYDLVIVGLEKAGKTSFLNAWLCINFLPTRRKRW